MLKTMIAFAAGFFILAAPASAQTAADSAGVRAAALDYIEGWYTADAARMERAIHPKLAKRWVRTDDNGQSMLHDMGAETLVEQTHRGGGSKTPPKERLRDVEILNLYEGMASVRVTSARYVDYMHLARWNGEWKIVNVLWDFRPKVEERASAQPVSDGPAARRLRELIAAVESGSSARIRAYVREAYAPEVWRSSNEDRVVQWYTTLYDRSRGFEIDSLRSTPTEAAALLRTKLTGLWEELSVRVEPEPPHRILAPAPFAFEPPEHPLPGKATDAERVREIKRIARRLSEANAFSGVVLLARDDSVLYLGAFGEADKERDIPIRPDTRFGLASITKTFVSVAIAKLVEQGKLSWDDPLRKFFPGFALADARGKVRIKHLLTHTSGLQDFLRYCERNPCPEEYRSMDDYIGMIALAQHDSLLYEPGTRSAYTNANFVVLGKIIERGSGQRFYEYIRNNVFRPAGMQDTDFSEPERAPARLAVGYEKQYTDEGVRFVGEEKRPEPIADYPAPYCCAYSTAGDLHRFAVALRSGRILRPETVDLLFSPKPEAGNWGYGFDILDKKRGLVGHGGSWTGISNSLDMFTRSGYTSVILSNYSYARSPLREVIWAVLP